MAVASDCAKTDLARSEEADESMQADTRLVARAVRRAQAGDKEAFAFLYARFADNIHGYVRSIVHDHHAAEDVTQHVFAKLFAVIGKYQERDVPFFAWMLRVARNVAVDHLRQQRLIPVEEVRATEVAGAPTYVTASARRGDLIEALATLPKDQREVLMMRHLIGLSPTEIAERSGKTEGSIHGLHHRGRRALKLELIERDAAPATRALSAHA
jgi:RNA polymerase sigma-70 factor (ECF subfamily)